MSRSRSSAIDSLLRCELPLQGSVEALASYDWDVAEPIAYLDRSHIESVCCRFLERELSGEQVEAWANAVESREDVTTRPGEDKLNEVVIRLANPYLNGAITEHLLREIIDELRLLRRPDA